MKRGDIVIVDLRPTNPAAKVRPALVLQNDRDNARMQNTILVQVTTNTRRSSEDTQYLIDPSHADWKTSGLLHPSVINCSTIYTAEQRLVLRVVGSLSETTMLEIENRIRAALQMQG